MNDDRVVSLLTEMRDNQREMLERQRAQLEIAQAPARASAKADCGVAELSARP